MIGLSITGGSHPDTADLGWAAPDGDDDCACAGETMHVNAIAAANSLGTLALRDLDTR